MKQRSIFVVLAALAVSACASGPQSRAPTEIDSAYVSAVERQASRAGVDVQWVNPPRRKRADEDQG